ncbi:hypothetical protein CU098_007766 [Rhizopus stolonifer]|uniref:Uncharacterized protein n=1 Tax=Rhizopus stolonifer TaxID=4846 RepID=A0A367JVS6_RHIST|nr:hypothetical protein CU098_007766 [Rhizopus stolonifer]
MNNENQESASKPPLPARNNNDNLNPFHTDSNREINPFLQHDAKPLTVRQELAQWRQDLREQSLQRSRNSQHNSRLSTPSLGLFKSTLSRYSDHNVQGQRRDTQETRSSLHHSVSTPNVNYSSRIIHRTYHSNHNRQSNNTLSPPELPTRRPSTDNNTPNSRTASLPISSNRNRPTPPIPQQSNYSNQADDVLSLNPFEESELPPPAYNEIQRDTVINLAP